MGSRGKLRLSGCDWKLVSLPAQTSEPLSETRAPSRCSPSGGSDHSARLQLFSLPIPRRVACNGRAVTQRRAAQGTQVRLRSPGGPQLEARVRTAPEKTS